MRGRRVANPRDVHEVVEDKELQHKDGQITPARVVSDTLTLARFGIAGILIYLGMFGGERALGKAILLTLVGWLTDVFDGPIARSSPDSRKTWVSRHDLVADQAMTYSFLLFLIFTGLLPLTIAFVYLIPAGLWLLHDPSENSLKVVSAPAAGLPAVLSFGCSLLLGVVYTVFLAITVVVRWDYLKAKTSKLKEEVAGR